MEANNVIVMSENVFGRTGIGAARGKFLGMTPGCLPCTFVGRCSTILRLLLGYATVMMWSLFDVVHLNLIQTKPVDRL